MCHGSRTPQATTNWCVSSNSGSAENCEPRSYKHYEEVDRRESSRLDFSLANVYRMLSTPILGLPFFRKCCSTFGRASMTQIRSALGGIPISRAIVTDFRTLDPESPLSMAVEHIVSEFQQVFLSWTIIGSWACLPE